MPSVVADKSIRAALAKFAPEPQAAVLAVLRQLPAAFGRPHAHAGLGVRQLRRGIFEARVSDLEVSISDRLIGFEDDSLGRDDDQPFACDIAFFDGPLVAIQSEHEA